jgi:hypothetical protein
MSNPPPGDFIRKSSANHSPDHFPKTAPHHLVSLPQTQSSPRLAPSIPPISKPGKYPFCQGLQLGFRFFLTASQPGWRSQLSCKEGRQPQKAKLFFKDFFEIYKTQGGVAGTIPAPMHHLIL